jgi:hypothetical protein
MLDIENYFKFKFLKREGKNEKIKKKKEKWKNEKMKKWKNEKMKKWKNEN